MSAQKNLELIQSIYAAFGRGDVPAIIERTSEDVEFGVISAAKVPWHGVGKGRGRVTEFFQALDRECVFTRFEPHSFIAGDGGVACMIDFDCTLKKNGKKVTMRALHHFTIANGKVTRWNGSEDTYLVEQMFNH